jgi:pentatricopeptide repeat protein
MNHASNALIALYGMHGHLDDALRTLAMMPRRDASAWNSAFTVCTHLGRCETALQLFAQMQLEGIEPNKVSFLTLLSACRTLAKMDEGKHIHSLLKASGIAVDVVLGTALVDMYSKCGDFDAALKVFTEMPSGNEVSWSAIVSAHARHGYGDEACSLYSQMRKEGMKAGVNASLCLIDACASAGNLVAGKLLHSCIVDDGDEEDDDDEDDNVVKNALVSMYNRCGSLADAHAVSKNAGTVYDAVSWNAMISANSQHGSSSTALDLFSRMLRKGVKPNANTFISVLSACSHTGLLREGLIYFLFMRHGCRIAGNPQHYTCMIDLLGRSGRLEEAEGFLGEMPLKPGVLDWMSLLSASRGHGDMERAQHAAKQTLELDSSATGAYVALTSILAMIGSGWDDESED